MTKKIEVAKRFNSLVSCIMCAENGSTKEEILEVANRENVCGTKNGWSEVVMSESDIPEYAKDGSCGDPMPVQCDDYEDRKHYVVLC